MAKSRMTKEQKRACQMRTSTFRVSYPHVFKPHAPKGGDKEKFSLTMLMPKDEEMLGWTIPEKKGGVTKRRKLKSIIHNACVAEFGPNKEDWPEELEKPIKDGDSKKNGGKEGYKGHWVVKATSHAENRPQVFDEQMNALEDTPEDRAKFYAGCFAQAAIFAYVWYYPNRENPMKIGVGIIVDSIQKQDDGKPFSSRQDGSEIFAPLEGGDDADADADEYEEMDFR